MLPAQANYPPYLTGNTINARRFTLSKTEGDITIPLSLSGAEIVCTFACGRESLEFKPGNGVSIINAAQGVFEIDSFTINVAGNYDYEVKIRFPNDLIRTYVRGTISILNGISK